MPVLRLPLLPAAAGKQHWGNLPGAALSLAIAEAASAAKRFTLLLTADSQSAERLEQELSFFAPDLPVLHFPDWETLLQPFGTLAVGGQKQREALGSAGSLGNRQAQGGTGEVAPVLFTCRSREKR